MTQALQSATAESIDTFPEENRGEADTQGMRHQRMREAVNWWVLAHTPAAATRASEGQQVAEDPTGSTLRTLNNAESPPLVRFPPPPTPVPQRATFHALQEWEGYVVDIGKDEFTARLVDLTAGHAHESEEAVIPLAEVSEYDASRMGVGRIFRWVIGYERLVEGTRRRVSQIVFRDLPRMTESDFRKGREWAESIVSAFGR